MTANLQQELNQIIEHTSRVTRLDTLIQGYRGCTLNRALGYRIPAEVFTSTMVEVTSTGMVESLTPDPPLRMAVPTLNIAPIVS